MFSSKKNLSISYNIYTKFSDIPHEYYRLYLDKNYTQTICNKEIEKMF